VLKLDKEVKMPALEIIINTIGIEYFCEDNLYPGECVLDHNMVYPHTNSVFELIPEVKALN